MSAAETSSPLSTQNRVLVRAVAATAAIVIVVAALFFCLFCVMYKVRRRWKNRFRSSFRREAIHIKPRQEFRQQQGGILKGLVVDETGLDVLYLRKGGQVDPGFSKVWTNPMGDQEEKCEQKGVDFEKAAFEFNHKNQKISLLQEPDHWQQTRNSISSKPPHSPSEKQETIIEVLEVVDNPLNRISAIPPSAPPPPPPPPPTQLIPNPPPAIQSRVKPQPPVPPAKAAQALSESPKVPLCKETDISRGVPTAEEDAENFGSKQIKLKPLHWDKVTANADHSMVWNEINDGSFRFDDDLMEILFGYPPISKESSEGNKKGTTSGGFNLIPDAQIFILDPRKSQNTAIVLKSLAICREEILDALMDGRGLGADILEKLTKIAPTKEEAASILQFDGNPTKLADAESFLYYILKAVPSAFIRLNAMLFKSNYGPEILHLKESLQALALACRELRSRGIFFKLLEAVLKAGNRMNAGTPRGNAQGFNLSTLRNLSNVKSTDGKTSLLHFVVEQVVQFEGKQFSMNQNDMIIRANIHEDSKASDHQDSENKTDQDYLMLGLPLVRCVSTELSNVKKSASIDFDSFISTCSTLTTRSNEIQQLILQCGNEEKGGFFRDMTEFLEECNEELNAIKEEQTKVMELVQRTTEYYQTGASKGQSNQPLQLFVIVKEFLDMVEQVCFDISKRIQRRSITNGWSTPTSPTPRTPVRFQNLKTYFMQDYEMNELSTGSEDDF